MMSSKLKVRTLLSIVLLFSCAALAKSGESEEKSLYNRVKDYASSSYSSVKNYASSSAKYLNPYSKSENWEWDTIKTEDTSFSADFKWGVSSAAYLTEGDCTNNQFLQSEDANKPSRKACDHWNRYQEDIELIKANGLNTYLFSIEWGKVEPQEGIFSDAAIDHYVAVVDALIAQGITPIITLHRYAHPIWFETKGGFEKLENITYFERFAQKMFERLGSKKAMWVTFYNPAAYAAKAFQKGSIPPFKKKMQLMLDVLENMLRAHVNVYYTLKNMPGGNAAQIGIAKHMYIIEPHNRINPLDRVGSNLANRLVNESVYNFFTSGCMNVRVPLVARKNEHTDNRARTSLDFVGLNYYSHGYLNNFRVVTNTKEQSTDNEIFTMYPEGLYQAIAQLSDNLAKELNVPILVTQNSIMTTDNTLREKFYKQHVYAVAKAIKDGYNVSGYLTDFIDHHAWGKETTDHIGLFSFNPTTLARMLKPGSQQFVNFVKKARA